MTTLTPKQLKKLRDRCQAIIDQLDSLKHGSLERGQITVDEFNDVTAWQYNIQNEITKLNNLLITRKLSSIAADENSPGALLVASVDELNHAIDRLNDMHEFLDVAAKVIKALGSVASIISTFPI